MHTYMYALQSPSQGMKTNDAPTVLHWCMCLPRRRRWQLGDDDDDDNDDDDDDDTRWLMSLTEPN